MMKKKALFLLVSLSFTLLAQAQTPKAEIYFTAADMPNLVKMNMCPPDSTSPQFAYDVTRYMWGKQQRLNKERAEIAYRDCVWGLETIINEFSEPFGLQISLKGTPEIYKLLNDALMTCDYVGHTPKKHFMRRRPFMVFNEPSLKPEDEPSLRQDGSWPSGHTILGYSAALLLTEINPDRADTIMARGLMYGESRVIVGAHWQSDVDAGRLAASMAVAKLHTSDRFLKQMALARQEFKKCVAAERKK